MAPAPLLYDAVTLRHFAAAEELDLFRALHQGLPPPRWTQAVADEIARCAAVGESECVTVQECAWLGQPHLPVELVDLVAIQRLRIALSGGPSDPARHIGEAETLHVAAKLGAAIATDDGPAYDFASRRLGPDRVRDTIDLLREAVRRHVRTSDQAAALAARIADAGRHLRRPHPPYPEADYFR